MKKTSDLYQKWLSLQPMSERKRFLLSQHFTVDYNFNSNHIEGNTLTYGQTEILLLFGKGILLAIKDNPDITIEAIAKKLGIVPLAVKKQLRQMVIKGYIQRRKKDGSWHVFASQSI